ncbi:MAG: FAD-dependent thymidylate synthase [Candidatus Improbicoccus pseudotrichonymphae]|uniref:Flavin-dependent thymidylate synthase n=1 Tax=Candidatus Improbicoccus pseudotrichonymphae TaxID=3033792 RepID=A0AA48I125_9FIRM|nr:MAG: FAD-dependent thymidylate synthase [Candidatus Improbicoccus pseudotrichonymphae]
MKVLLLSHTPDPERVVVCAAKLCYSSLDISEIYEKKNESDFEFIRKLIKLGHESPFEHISFTFGIEGVSRVFLAQLTRHRIASYSVRSQRYVKEENFSFVIPPEILNFPEAKREFEKAAEASRIAYEKITKILNDNNENSEKKSIEDARYVLFGAMETKIVCTFNARSLLNFFKLRTCKRAQWEIRDVASEMLRLVKKVAPNVFSNSGPPCIQGACNQGKMGCKK